MKTAKQPSAMPTRKLMAGLPIMGAVAEVWGGVMIDIYPPIAGSEFSLMIGMLAGMAIAYFVPDAPNVPS